MVTRISLRISDEAQTVRSENALTHQEYYRKFSENKSINSYVQSEKGLRLNFQVQANVPRSGTIDGLEKSFSHAVD